MTWTVTQYSIAQSAKSIVKAVLNRASHASAKGQCKQKTESSSVGTVLSSSGPSSGCCGRKAGLIGSLALAHQDCPLASTPFFAVRPGVLDPDVAWLSGLGELPHYMSAALIHRWVRMLAT